MFHQLSPNFVTFPKIYWRLKFQYQCLIGVSAVSMATAVLKTDFSILAINLILNHFIGFSC